MKRLFKQRHENRDKLSTWKVAAYASLAIVAILFVCVLVLLLFPDTYINGYLKGRIISGFTKAYPAYVMRIGEVHYNVFKNSIEVDSIALKATKSNYSYNIDTFSVRGISWIQVLREGDIAPNSLTNSSVNAQRIEMTFGRYMLHCKQLSSSVPDSTIMAEALEIHPVGTDEHFFAQSKFSDNRIRFVLPQCRVTGADLLGLMQGTIYRVRSVQVDDANLDVLLNRDKPYDETLPSPLMPNEILMSIKELFRVDSIKIIHGRVQYAERFVIGAKPGVVTFDNIKMSAEGITNHASQGAVMTIHAQAHIWNSGAVNVHMSIPVASKELTFRYSGSLGEMDLDKINPFLEVAEHTRVKSGIVHEATFDINVTAGHATGSVRGEYENFSIAILDKRTGSESGVRDRITSFIANLMKFRKNNMPDKSGKMKIGVVNYTRKPDETFIQFVWPALRGGLGNVAGF